MAGLRTRHISGALKRPGLKRRFRTLEVSALNEIPHTGVWQHRPAIYIVNADPNFLGGSHWVAMCLRKQHVPEFFDPLGRSPSSYSSSLVRFLRSSSSHGRYEFVKRRIQGQDSLMCGAYCLLYAFARGHNFHRDLRDICAELEAMSEVEVLIKLGNLLASH